MAEAAVHIHLKRVVIADTSREPRPRVGDRSICPCGGWYVERTCRNRSTSQGPSVGTFGYVAGQGEAGQMTGNGSLASMPIRA